MAAVPIDAWVSAVSRESLNQSDDGVLLSRMADRRIGCTAAGIAAETETDMLEG